MFLNKKNLNITEIFPKKKELKELKKQYQLQNFQKLFLQKDVYIYFYYYENLLPEHRKFLVEKDLKSFYIKKKLFKSFSTMFENNFFQNIIANNSLLITSRVKNQPNSIFPVHLKDLKNLFFLGFFLNNKFFRPSEIKIFQTKNFIECQKIILKCFVLQKQLLIKSLLFKN